MTEDDAHELYTNSRALCIMRGVLEESGGQRHGWAYGFCKHCHIDAAVDFAAAVAMVREEALRKAAT